MICLYLYEYLLLWDILYIIGNSLMNTFQCKFDCVNLSSHSWDISKQRFYSYWWSDISVVCCDFCTSCIYVVCENWSTGCKNTSWIKFVTRNLVSKTKIAPKAFKDLSVRELVLLKLFSSAFSSWSIFCDSFWYLYLFIYLLFYTLIFFQFSFYI